MKKGFILVSIISVIGLLIMSFSLNNIEVANGAGTQIFWGSEGDDVKQVQTKLKNWKYYDGDIDGVYGEQLYTAVVDFQKKNGLNPDGIVGDSTKEKMGISSNSSSANSTSDEIRLLAQAITGEARGEPYLGQVAVGAVILNRSKDPRFPQSIAGVIYQPGAFTCVADGQINIDPPESCIKAAKDALNGWDPTSESIYYWNPATATSDWIWSLKPTLKIGKHWFARGPY